MRPLGNTGGLEDFTASILGDARFARNIVARRDIPACDARWGDWPEAVIKDVRDTLASLGVERLYTHQQEAINAALDGHDLVISTGVASGKSLCYQVPILQSCSALPRARAMMLYPTKALAQDQMQKMLALLSRFSTVSSSKSRIHCGIYDGDTPTEARRSIRMKANIVFSNPDMLHQGILPNHTLWAEFFANLQWVVIDEVHYYRGVFGSHFANVLRRLKRVCALYGSSPHFICTSATLANSVQLAQDIIERPVKSISDDASPHGEQLFVILNPPMVDPALGIRRASVLECCSLARRFLTTSAQALLFTISRRSVEILYMYLAGNQDLIQRVRTYRSGYLPEERRAIEKALRHKDISMVISTNALELGIDIGGLDAVLMNGYPGTISATRQQAGRAGRVGNPSLCLLVAAADPLDQYISQHPDYLFDSNPESALVAPDHHEILRSQLLCAVHDLAFLEGESFGHLSYQHVFPHLQILCEDGLVRKTGNRWVGIMNAYPAADVSLRNVSGQMLIEYENSLIGYVDRDSAMWMTHPGAVYLDKGDSWIVRDLDLENARVKVEPFRANYYTKALRHSEIELTALEFSQTIAGGRKYRGKVKVSSTITGFKKIRYYTMENLGQEELDLPPTILDTDAWWIALDPEVVKKVRDQNLWRNDPANYGREWPKLRNRIRERDGFKCARCGIKENSDEFAVHHIRPIRMFSNLEEANDFANLITLCPRCHSLAEASVRVQSGLAGLAYLLVNLCPFYVMCDRKDLESFFEDSSSLANDAPVVLIHDTIPGGIGLSRKLYDLSDRLLREALQLVSSCSCREGCPACVGPVAENGSGAKQHVIAILKELVGGGGIERWED
jgi:DEAD/DEAH box helicase domain-containing protein